MNPKLLIPLVTAVGVFFIAFFPANQVVGATLTPTPTPALTMEFGKVETVYDYDWSPDGNSKQSCDELDHPDIVAKALIDADGNVQLYATSSVSNRKSMGDNLSDVVHQCP